MKTDLLGKGLVPARVFSISMMTKFRFDDADISLGPAPGAGKAKTLAEGLFGLSATGDAVDFPREPQFKSGPQVVVQQMIGHSFFFFEPTIGQVVTHGLGGLHAHFFQCSRPDNIHILFSFMNDRSRTSG